MGAIVRSWDAFFATVRSGRIAVAFWPLLMLLSLSSGANELIETNLERQVKAAMLYKFLGYVEWPPESFATPLSPYVIAVAGASDVSRELRHLTAERTVNERPIVVKTVTSKSDLNGVHLLFVGQDNSETLHMRLMKRAREHSLVTVTENERGLDWGSVINFRLIQDRIGFDVSLVNAGAHKLKLSARLLGVASYVEVDGR